MPFLEKCSFEKCGDCPLVGSPNRVGTVPGRDGTTVNVVEKGRDGSRATLASFALDGQVSAVDAVQVVLEREAARGAYGPVETPGKFGFGRALQCCVVPSDEQYAKSIQIVEITPEALTPQLAPGEIAA